jgi:carboxypeptidase Q
MTGSQALENAIDYIIDLSNKRGMDNVHKEATEVPVWKRGAETLTLLKPKVKDLRLLGLGLSIPTPTEGIVAKVIVVRDFDELRALDDAKVAGKIVVYNEPWVSYGETVQYRRKGAVEASKKGAVAALVRSVTPFSIASPHTGVQNYEDDVRNIPVAAISHEDVDMMSRMQERSEEIEVRLVMCNSFDTGTSYNVVSEIKGIDDKIVIISGHIDSWDTGDGAMDDGGGSIISWLAPVVLKKLHLRPRRTLRTVLFTAEEVGIVGANAYAKLHEDESDKYSFVMESDSGTFRPLGIAYDGVEEGQCVIKEILKLFNSINTTTLAIGGAGPDIDVWTSQGIPGGGFLNANEKYFWFHHSEGDRITVLDSDALDLGGAFWTAFSFVMADMKYEIPRGTTRPFIIET